jgi:hypothetical protein
MFERRHLAGLGVVICEVAVAAGQVRRSGTKDQTRERICHDLHYSNRTKVSNDSISTLAHGSWLVAHGRGGYTGRN